MENEKTINRWKRNEKSEGGIHYRLSSWLVSSHDRDIISWSTKSKDLCSALGAVTIRIRVTRRVRGVTVHRASWRRKIGESNKG